MTDEADEPNEPERLPGHGMRGVVDVVNKDQQVARRVALMQLAINGVSRDEMHHAMNDKFGMTSHAVDKLLLEVRKRLVAESEDATPYKKASAEQRIHRAIAAAAKRNAWSAVANLEMQLARIQGTEAAQQIDVHVEHRITQATMHVLSAMSPQEVQELVESEVQRLPLPNTLLPSK